MYIYVVHSVSETKYEMLYYDNMVFVWVGVSYHNYSCHCFRHRVLLKWIIAGTRPIQSKGTVIRIRVSSETRQDEPMNEWKVSVKTVSRGTIITFTIVPAATATIGPYVFSVESLNRTAEPDSHEINRHTVSGVAFYLIFNPWCPGK